MSKNEPIIKVTDLIKEFGNFTAVEKISFEVKEGEIFAFLGPNGAGKTTSIKMLTTLLTPTSGTISLNGFDPVSEQEKARKSFGIVFQDPSLDDELTAYENLEFHGVLYGVPKALRHKRIEEMLKYVDLWERKDSLIKTFSGGMKRRLEIARGLLHHPKIFFLDEPTLGLDPQTRNHIWSYIKKLNQEEGITVFFTTHYMDEAARVADRVAIIDHGKIIKIDTVRGLLQKTKKNNLEDAFLALTGHEIRDEAVGARESMRMRHQAWTRH